MLNKLVHNVMVETLFIWLIMFDYAVLFPTKVFIVRIKNDVFESVHNKWTTFADNCAKMNALMIQHPEFVLVMSVLFIECFALACNIKRTAMWIGNMVKASRVH